MTNTLESHRIGTSQPPFAEFDIINVITFVILMMLSADIRVFKVCDPLIEWVVVCYLHVLHIRRGQPAVLTRRQHMVMKTISISSFSQQLNALKRTITFKYCSAVMKMPRDEICMSSSFRKKKRTNRDKNISERRENKRTRLNPSVWKLALKERKNK